MPFSFFKSVRAHLGPYLEEASYHEEQRTPPNSVVLSFSKLTRKREFRLLIQRNAKALFVPLIGSSFVLELRTQNARRSARVCSLLPRQDLREFARIQNEIIARVPPVTQAALAPHMTGVDDLDRWTKQVFEDALRPLRVVRSDEDHWMKYRDDEDVKLWSAFIGPRVLSMESRFFSGHP